MNRRSKVKYFCNSLVLLALCVLSLPQVSKATETSWGGLYRVEAINIQNPAMSSTSRFDKSYFLHHLTLQPKIVAMDGITLHGGLEVFNNANYPDTQMGDFLGGTPSQGGSQGSGTTGVNTQTQKAQTIEVSSFYLKWATEYGVLVAGRVPMQFGLGITHNAGRGLFDHFYDSRDLVGYKFVAGNLYFFPMYGKVKEGLLGIEDDINAYSLQVEYDNPDSEVSMGLFYDIRIATKGANENSDGVVAGVPYGRDPSQSPEASGVTKEGTYNVKTLNLFVKRSFGNFNVGFESSFANGSVGVKDRTGRNVTLDAYALALELDWKPSGAWNFDLKTGLATGDDPGTTDRYEGYFFDRNYNLGSLLFNHALGSYDVLGSSYFRNSPATGATSHDYADVEYLTNAFYVSPGAVWNFTEKWNMNSRWVWAQLQRDNPLNFGDTSVKNDLGVEWDLGLNYQPHSNLSAELGTAMFWPGEAFVGGSSKFRAGFAYGFTAKAAIRF